MDQTQIINNAIQSMGGSGSTNPANYSSSKSLNYAKDSNNINRAKKGQLLTAIPYTLKYQDSVGLFGSENIFLKVDLDIKSSRSIYTCNPFPINDYFDPCLTTEIGEENNFETGELDFSLDLVTENGYFPATITSDLTAASDPYTRIDLTNLKTGNKFIDAWFDVRLYRPDGVDHPYDRMYLPLKSYFYIGFHARNTRRLPYNVEVLVGENYFSYKDIPKSETRYVVRPTY